MDVRHAHGSDIHVVRACHHDDGVDLLAVGGNHSVQVLLTVSRLPAPRAARSDLARK